jgi:hypothetical protein
MIDIFFTEDEFRRMVTGDKDKCQQDDKFNRTILELSKYKCRHDRTKEDMKEYGEYCDGCPIAFTRTCHKPIEFEQK